MLRLTKCKDSENHGHNAAFTKKVYTLGAEDVHESNTMYNFVWWETVNFQVHISTSVVLVQIFG